MGKIRAYSKRQKWSEPEIQLLIEKYETTPRNELLTFFPFRDIRKIESKANFLGLKRPKIEKRTQEETRRAKREHMARKRAADPDAARAYSREYHHKNRDKSAAKMRDYYARRFFWGRAMKLRGDGRATFIELARLWRLQSGRCAITGRRLNRDNAHLDHIVAKARGGSDKLSNLRWLCTEANLAKRELSDVEFVALCADVMRWIGQRIAEVDKIKPTHLGA